MIDPNVLSELRAKLPINMQRLHLDAENQPELMCMAIEVEAEARYEAKKAKLAVEVCKAEVSNDIRLYPEKYGLTKTTEAAIEITVLKDLRVIDSQTRFLDLEREANMAGALVQAYENRKSMLQLEGQLFISNYWNEVKISDVGIDKAKQAGRSNVEYQVENIRGERVRGKVPPANKVLLKNGK